MDPLLLTHCLVVRPPEGTIRPRQCSFDIEALQGRRQRDAGELCVVGKVTELLDLADAEAGKVVLGGTGSAIVLIQPQKRLERKVYIVG